MQHAGRIERLIPSHPTRLGVSGRLEYSSDPRSRHFLSLKVLVMAAILTSTVSPAIAPPLADKEPD